MSPSPGAGGAAATGASAAAGAAAAATAERPRGPSTRGILRISWDYPVYQATEPESGTGTAVARPREALSRDDALHAIAGKDPRPLLVVRECKVCNKTDDALLRPGAQNERTILLSRWFHCVKVPVDVLQPDHPFNALFPDTKSEHLFVSASDGTGKIPLESDTSRVELWASMSRALAAAYSKDPSTATKDITKVLDKLDLLDERVRGLEKSRDDLLETSGKLDERKVKKLDGEIEAIRKEIEKSIESIDRLSKYDLKPPSKA